MSSISTFLRPLAVRPNSNWTDWGQWLALITMTIDHVVRYLAPELMWASSSIGRVAFPLFAGMVAWHGCFNTRNPFRYGRRIMTIGLVAQLPYMLLPRSSWQWNVCFTLGLGLMWVSVYRDLWRAQENKASGWGTLSLPLFLLASLVGWYWLGNSVEYGHLGLLFVPALSFAMLAWHPEVGVRIARPVALLALLLALLNAGLLNSSLLAKSITVLTTAAVLCLLLGAARWVPRVILPMHRKMWLSWYPAHLAVIAACVALGL